jgi:hypothetical protein
MVKETLNVQINHMSVPLLAQRFHTLGCRVGTTTRPEAVTVFMEISLKDRTKNIMNRLLTYPVSDRMYAYGRFFLLPGLSM